MNILDTLGNLVNQTAFFSLTVGNYIMILVACVFLYLAIKKGYEPLGYLCMAKHTFKTVVENRTWK